MLTFPLPPQIAAPLAIAKRVVTSIPREVWYALAVMLALWWFGHSRYEAGQADCRAAYAHAQQRANDIQVKAERKRDARASAIAAESNTKAAKATARTQEATRARAQQIDAVPTTGACRAPAGLPDLAPAVDAANAARRAAVPEGRYTRRQFRAMAGPGDADHGRLGEGADGVGEQHARDPDAGAPAPSG